MNPVTNIGDKIGPYTIHGYRTHKNCRLLLVECFCGARKMVRLDAARRSKSCGCLTRGLIAAGTRKHGHSNYRGERTRTYRSWRSMIQRCELESQGAFPAYGGRGISVCDRWHTFSNFLADMGERPANKTIGRIDNEGNYEAGNCAWETNVQQSRNRRSSVFLTFGGRTAVVADWAEITGIPRPTLYGRLYKGWTPERALTTPVRGMSLIELPSEAGKGT